MSKRQEEIVTQMTLKFGELMSAAETREVLKFKTASALWMARKRGQVQLEAVRIPGRKQFMYSTQEVALLLASWKAASKDCLGNEGTDVLEQGKTESAHS